MTDQQTKLDTLKQDLLSEMDIEQLFQKHIVDGKSYFFSDFLNDANLEYMLRHELAQTLGISINDVVIVGSAKLGFSVKNEKFEKFDGRFSRTYKEKHRSDIDIAIVNRRVFDAQAELIFEISRHFNNSWIDENWKHNIYNRDDETLQQKGIQSLFINYVTNLAKGWLRVDYSPSIYINSLHWSGLIEKWRTTLKRKVSIAVYSDWHYLKHYQMDNLQNLRIKTRALEI